MFKIDRSLKQPKSKCKNKNEHNGDWKKKILYIHKTKKYVHLFNNHEYN